MDIMPWWIVIPAAFIGFIVLVYILTRWLTGPYRHCEPSENPWYVRERRALEQVVQELEGGYPELGFGYNRSVIATRDRAIKACEKAGVPVPLKLRKDLRDALYKVKEAKKRIGELAAFEALVDAGYATGWEIERGHNNDIYR